MLTTLCFICLIQRILWTLRDALDVFCLASGARINWAAKSTGFTVGVEDTSAWGQDVGFTWMLPGHSCRYLGSLNQIGIGILSAQQFDPVLSSIRGKLCH